MQVTAYDLYGNIKTNETTGKLEGLATSPGCMTCSPTLTATQGTYGDNDTSVWSSGIGTFSGVTAYNAQTGAQLTIRDGTVSNTSNTFTVTHAGALKGFTINTAIATPQTAGTAIAGNVVVTAYDLYGNVKKDDTTGRLERLDDLTRLPDAAVRSCTATHCGRVWQQHGRCLVERHRHLQRDHGLQRPDRRSATISAGIGPT